MERQTTPARVLVADDHPIVRLGVRQMLGNEPDLSVCAEVTTPEATLQALQTEHPDIAVIDLSFGELNGLALIRRMHEIAPQVPVLVLSMHDEALFADRALKAGAKGYIMKHEAITSLVSAIRCVLSGRIYVSDQMAQQALEGIRQNRGGGHDPVADLSDRELQVLTLIGRGPRHRPPLPPSCMSVPRRSRPTGPTSRPSSICETAPSSCALPRPGRKSCSPGLRRARPHPFSRFSAPG